MALTGAQKKYLKGLAHSLKPVVMLGQKGLTDSVLDALEEAFETHELLKVKFLDIKEKEDKKKIAQQILQNTQSDLVGEIGHTLILFRPAKKPENRKTTLP